MVVVGATPGCNASKSVKLRPFSGTAVILVPDTTSPNWVSTVSTWVALAVTVICSLRAPSTRWTSTRKALFVSTASCEARYVRNPLAATSRSYVPTARSGKAYTPLASLATVWRRFVAVLVAVTWAPDTGSPRGSQTVPEMLPPAPAHKQTGESTSNDSTAAQATGDCNRVPPNSISIPFNSPGSAALASVKRRIGGAFDTSTPSCNPLAGQARSLRGPRRPALRRGARRLHAHGVGWRASALPHRLGSFRNFLWRGQQFGGRIAGEGCDGWSAWNEPDAIGPGEGG